MNFETKNNKPTLTLMPAAPIISKRKPTKPTKSQKNQSNRKIENQNKNSKTDFSTFGAYRGKLKMNGTRTPRAKNPNDESLIFEIASKDIGKLIGRAGARINELRNQSNCQVIFFKMAALFLPTLPLPLSVD